MSASEAWVKRYLQLKRLCDEATKAYTAAVAEVSTAQERCNGWRREVVMHERKLAAYELVLAELGIDPTQTEGEHGNQT